MAPSSTTEVITASAACKECGSNLGRRFRNFWTANDYKCQGNECPHRLCSTCYIKRPLFVGDNLDTAIMKHFCKSCFESTSTIDFSQTYESMEGSSDYIFVFVHGGAGSRAMFKAHATEMNQRFGHACILMDLPGHASLVDTPLTLETCSNALHKVLTACNITSDTTKKKVIYVGGSLGAYVGFYLLDKHKTIFDGAVLIDCGQNVGPGASFKARAGLVMLSYLGSHMSNAALLSLMVKEVKKSGADYKLLETCFGSGMFFEQAPAQVECLKAVAPADYIPRLDIPILFMNGSKDYRDSENRWLELCVNQQSELKVYEGGDHFFTHYTCFVEDIMSRFDSYAKAL
jgi:pimeloyl-ACP methyl ester carboxylesterase